MKYRKILAVGLMSMLLSGCSGTLLSDLFVNANDMFREKHWAEGYMNTLIESGTMSGYPDGSLGLDDPMTREQASAVIYNLTGKVEPSASHFIDVPMEIWSFNAINSLEEQGIISVPPEGTFRPYENITRADFCVMIYNFLMKKGLDDVSEYMKFPDTQGISAEKPIGVLSDLGVVKGYENGSFTPNDIVTRGQAAKMIISAKNIAYSLGSEEHTDILSALTAGFNQFDSIFSFRYDSKLTPQDVVDKYRANFTGTYYEGIVSNLNVEVRTRGDKSHVYIKSKYLHTKDQEQELTDFVKANAQSIMENYSSDVDRIRAAHDLIVDKAEYNEGDANGIGSAGISVHSPYSIIATGEGVCQAYALMNYRLLKEMGYNTVYITGDAHNKSYSGPHAWNMVQIGPNWYHIDPTWDDPVSEFFNISSKSHDYFLITDAKMAEDHNWDKTKYPSALNPIDIER